MIIDLLLIASAVGAVFSGFRRGFLQSLLSTIGYIGGGVAGLALELARVAVIAFMIVSVILWSPWTSARKAVAESTLYPKISKQMPHVLDQLRLDVEKKLKINLR